MIQLQKKRTKLQKYELPRTPEAHFPLSFYLTIH